MSERSPASSPLDPYLARFLQAVRESGDGVQPGAGSRAIVESLDLPAAFVDVLFTSARTRGLLKPQYGRGNKIRWDVSRSGEALIHSVQDAREAPGE